MGKKGKRHSRKKRHGGKKSHRGGHVPLKILERRLPKLNKVVAARGGKHYSGSPS
jgi:hypothetical protein